jgi:hypothetical protein
VAPWKLPLVVALIAVPVVAAFYAGGPGAGVGAGALAAVAIVALAARQRPRRAIGIAPSAGDERRLLLVVTGAVEDPGALEQIAVAARAGEAAESPAEVMVLAPARIGFLDRWASDVEGARRAAQENLVLTVAALAKAGVRAEGRVGDEDVVQAVEDQIGGFPATEVILAGAGEDEAAAAELESRLRPPFRRLPLSRPAAG